MDDVLIYILLSALAGAVIGALVMWFIRRKPDHSTAALAKKHEEFREEVSDHFLKTAELVNQMTHSYKAVYDHLRDGARDLLDEESLRQRLANTEREPITLSLLDQPTGSKAKVPSPTADQQKPSPLDKDPSPPEGSEGASGRDSESAVRVKKTDSAESS